MESVFAVRQSDSCPIWEKAIRTSAIAGAAMPMHIAAVTTAAKSLLFITSSSFELVCIVNIVVSTTVWLSTSYGKCIKKSMEYCLIMVKKHTARGF
jgi:hypothetical protein